MLKIYPTPLVVLSLLLLLNTQSSAGTNDNAKIAIHLADIPTGKAPSICNRAPYPPCNVGQSNLDVQGLVGVGYDLYFLVLDGDTTAGVSGASFGIEYGPNLLVGTWTRCAKLDFQGGPTGVTWPDSGSGNAITWDYDANCQNTAAAGDSSGGVTAVLGALYVYAYGDDIFRLTKREYIANPDFDVADCSAAESYPPFPDNAGSVAFGDSIGFDPCVSQQEASGGGGSIWSTNTNGRFDLDSGELDDFLSSVPMEFSLSASNPPVMNLPMPDGTYKRFEIRESPILAQRLVAEMPNTRTYVLRGVADRTATGRASRTSLGFHAGILSAVDGSVYVQPSRVRGESDYVSFRRRRPAVNCLWTPQATSFKTQISPSTRSMFPVSSAPSSSGDTLFTYKMVVNGTGEFTDSFDDTTDAKDYIAIIVNLASLVPKPA